MSHAFGRSNNQQLADIGPNINSLFVYITRKNGGIQVFEKENFKDIDGNSVHLMSNGTSYSKGRSGSWEIV